MSFHLHCYYCGPSHSISQLHSWNNVLTNLPASKLTPVLHLYSGEYFIKYKYDYVTPRFQAFPSFIFWPSGTHIPTFAPLNILWFLELFGLQAFAYCFICLEDFSLSSDYFPLTKMNKRKVPSLGSLPWYIWTSFRYCHWKGVTLLYFAPIPVLPLFDTSSVLPCCWQLWGFFPTADNSAAPAGCPTTQLSSTRS